MYLYDIMTWVMPVSAILIFCTGVYLTMYFNWINVRSFKFAIKEVIQSNIFPKGEGSISHFQHLRWHSHVPLG